MVIVKLQGGIGNQLFQFAFGRALAELRKDELFFDLSFLNANIPNMTNRLFRLGHLHNYRIVDYDIFNLMNGFFYNGNAVLISDDFPKNQITEVANDINIKALYLDGYFQNQFYFLMYANKIIREIRDLLKYHYDKAETGNLKDTHIRQKSVGIHLRRTDYLSPAALSVHGICEVSYYQRALDIILSKIDYPHFYLFSDDSQFADDMFSLIEDKTNMSAMINSKVSQEKDLVELAIMSKCSNFIIANSSYSWWGSYLSETPDKIIIAPQRWYQNVDFKQQSEDIALASWIRI